MNSILLGFSNWPIKRLYLVSNRKYISNIHLEREIHVHVPESRFVLRNTLYLNWNSSSCSKLFLGIALILPFKPCQFLSGEFITHFFTVVYYFCKVWPSLCRLCWSLNGYADLVPSLLWSWEKMHVTTINIITVIWKTSACIVMLIRCAVVAVLCGSYHNSHGWVQEAPGGFEVQNFRGHEGGKYLAGRRKSSNQFDAILIPQLSQHCTGARLVKCCMRS